MTLGLMTKYWITGEVKTRLGVDIGMERAAKLHRRFVSHLCRTLATAADRRVVSLSPEGRLDQFARDLAEWDLQTAWRVTLQGTGDLGERMRVWFQLHLDAGETSCQRAVLIGADCPTVGPDDIAAAGELLNDNDVVLGPAADGGYYLIGIRGPWPVDRSPLDKLFLDIPWSSKNVLSATRERLGSAGLSHAELELREDIDTVNELNRFRKSIQSPDHPLAELASDISRIVGDRMPSKGCTQ